MAQMPNNTLATRRRRSKIDRIERIAKFVQNLTIIFGVFAGALALLTSQHDKRVQNVLALRTEFVAAVRSDYLKLLSDWNNYSPAAAILSASIDEQKQIVSDFFSKDENKNALLSVVDFFDTLSACIEYHACDRNTAIYLFQTTAQDVFEIAGFHIQADRQADRDPGFARGLETIYRMERESLLLSYL